MTKAYRRFRIKRGDGTWDNVTQSASGTKISRSNKTHNTTTNVNSKRITVYRNDSGWIRRQSKSMHPKYKSSHKSKKLTYTGKTLLELLSSNKKKSKNKNSVKQESWLRRAFNALERAADEAAAEKKTPIVETAAPSLSFEDRAKAIAERQAEKARIAREARGEKVSYAQDKPTGFTIGQKRFLLLSLFVIIFIIQKCSG